MSAHDEQQAKILDDFQRISGYGESDLGQALRAGAAALRRASPETGWQVMDSAPKGSGWDGPQDTRHPDYVQPPRILGLVDGQPEVVYWDWYYSEGGNGYQPGQSAWVGTDGNVNPTMWMPILAPPEVPHAK